MSVVGERSDRVAFFRAKMGLGGIRGLIDGLPTEFDARLASMKVSRGVSISIRVINVLGEIGMLSLVGLLLA